ncbi:MAG: radical SAM protein, partial [Verrucomicrobia bacterium]|nr:radical SAM protein [Verrucomicrobiota bacterium]
MTGLAGKIVEGERITEGEAKEIYDWPLAKLGEMAHARRNRAKVNDYDGRGKEVVTYMVDRNINYTNVCDVYCKFCAFYRTEKDGDHYVLSQGQIDQKIDELVAVGGNQILLQGGHHPKLGLEWYLDLLRHLRAKYPQINVHGFSPPEFN